MALLLAFGAFPALAASVDAPAAPVHVRLPFKTRLLASHGYFLPHPERVAGRASPGTTSTSPNYTFFDMPSSTDTQASAPNPGVGGVAMHVVGCYVPNSGSNGELDGFEYTLTSHSAKSTATFEPIGPKNEGFCPFMSNDSGVIVGGITSAATAGATEPGFILDGGVLTTLNAPYPGVCITVLWAINDAGTIAGESEANSDCTATGGWTEGAFLYSNGVYTQLAGLPGANSSYATGINSSGTVIGTSFLPASGTQSGWILQGGVYTPIAYPGSRATIPISINDSGEIVGNYSCPAAASNCSAGDTLGFLYKNGTYSTVSIPGVTYTSLWGIDNKGEMTGTYFDVSGYFHSFLLKQ